MDAVLHDSGRRTQRSAVHFQKADRYPRQTTMLLDQLRARRDVVVALGRRYGARHVRVFGSVARGEERPDSDVDLLVELDRGYDLFMQRMPLTDQLSELFGRRVDLVPEHELNPHMRERILREAIPL